MGTASGQSVVDQFAVSVLMGTASGQSAVDQFAVSVLMGTASGQSTVARINLFALSVLMGTASGQSAVYQFTLSLLRHSRGLNSGSVESVADHSVRSIPADVQLSSGQSVIVGTSEFAP